MSIAEKLTILAENEEKVFEAGYEKFLRDLTNNGVKGTAYYMFTETVFDDVELDAKYFENIYGAHHMFYDYRGARLPKGIEIPLATDLGINGFGAASKIEEIYDMKAPIQLRYNQTFTTCGKLKRILMPLKFSEETTISNPFVNCFELVDLTIEGVIGNSGIDLHWSTKLSKESIESFINALSTTKTGKSITFSQTARNNAFTDEEWATLISTKPNWTISLA